LLGTLVRGVGEAMESIRKGGRNIKWINVIALFLRGKDAAIIPLSLSSPVLINAYRAHFGHTSAPFLLPLQWHSLRMTFSDGNRRDYGQQKCFAYELQTRGFIHYAIASGFLSH